MSETQEIKAMTLELLSAIKGARPSEAVQALFTRVKDTPAPSASESSEVFSAAVDWETLRPDEVEESTETEKNIISANFPDKKNNFLVVSKALED